MYATFFQQSGSKKVDITLKPFSDETSLEIACRWQTCMGGQVNTIIIFFKLIMKIQDVPLNNSPVAVRRVLIDLFWNKNI